jgi:hypothetical protein
MFENKVLRRIFGTKREDLTPGWRGLHNRNFSFHSSPNNIRVIKSRIMK